MTLNVRSVGLFVVLVLAFLSGTVVTITTAQSPVPSNFLTIVGTAFSYKGQTVYLHGENFNNLPALGARIGSGNITDINVAEADYAQLNTLGGNHVRFGMSFSWYLANRAQFFQVIDQHVAWAKAHHIWIILLQFTTPNNCYEGYSTRCSIWGSATEQNQLRAFWVDVATHYQNEPTIVGFDLLNEPTPSSVSGQWYPLAQAIRDAITAVDPNHFIVIESGAGASFPSKFNGANIVYSVHDYVPNSLALSSSGTYPYPGYAPDWNGNIILWNKAAFSGQGDPQADLHQRLAVSWAAQNNVPLYVGEWGTRNLYSGYATYIKDRFDLFNAWGVHYAHYVWRHNPTFWSIYPMRGPLVTVDPAMEKAVQAGFAGSVQPDMAPGTSATPFPTPTMSTATSSTTASATSTPTQTAVLPSSTPTQTAVLPSNTPTQTAVLPSSTPTQTAVLPSSTPTQTAILPTNAPTSTSVSSGSTFYRAINLNGPALTIDGNAWESGTAPNFTSSGAQPACNPWATLSPTTDANRTQMIQCFRMGWSTMLNMSALPTGSYSVYLYEWEDWQPRVYSVSVNGQVVLPSYNSGSAGTWHKLGPWPVQVTTGSLTLNTYGGVANLSGLEVWRTDSLSPTNTPSLVPTFTPTTVPPTSTQLTSTLASSPDSDPLYRAINLNGPALTIDGNSWEGSSAPNYTVNGWSFCNQGVALNPLTDANRTSMIRCSQYGQSMSLTMNAMPSRSYNVYLYTWEDNYPETFSISVNGQVVLPSYNSGSAGTWHKLGPWPVQVTTGSFNLSTSGGMANLSGIEVWQTSAIVNATKAMSVTMVPTSSQPQNANAALPAAALNVMITPTPTQPLLTDTTSANQSATPSLTVIPADNPLVRRFGQWTSTTTNRVMTGRYLYSNGSNPALSLTFTGTSIGVVYLLHPALGHFTIAIDGQVVQQVNEKGTTTFDKQVTITHLTNAVHQVRISAATGSIAVEAFLVSQSAAIAQTSVRSPTSTPMPTYTLTSTPFLTPTVRDTSSAPRTATLANHRPTAQPTPITCSAEGCSS